MGEPITVDTHSYYNKKRTSMGGSLEVRGVPTKTDNKDDLAVEIYGCTKTYRRNSYRIASTKVMRWWLDREHAREFAHAILYTLDKETPPEAPKPQVVTTSNSDLHLTFNIHTNEYALLQKPEDLRSLLINAIDKEIPNLLEL